MYQQAVNLRGLCGSVNSRFLGKNSSFLLIQYISMYIQEIARGNPWLRSLNLKWHNLSGTLRVSYLLLSFLEQAHLHHDVVNLLQEVLVRVVLGDQLLRQAIQVADLINKSRAHVNCCIKKSLYRLCVCPIHDRFTGYEVETTLKFSVSIPRCHFRGLVTKLAAWCPFLKVKELLFFLLSCITTRCKSKYTLAACLLGKHV